MGNFKSQNKAEDQLINDAHLKAKIHPNTLKSLSEFLQSKGYFLVKYLGKGAFTVVFSARSQIDGDVAIKIMIDNESYSEIDFGQDECFMRKFIHPSYSIQQQKTLYDKHLKSYFFISELCDCNPFILTSFLNIRNGLIIQQAHQTNSFQNRNQQ